MLYFWGFLLIWYCAYYKYSQHMLHLKSEIKFAYLQDIIYGRQNLLQISLLFQTGIQFANIRKHFKHLCVQCVWYFCKNCNLGYLRTEVILISSTSGIKLEFSFSSNCGINWNTKKKILHCQNSSNI